MQSDGKRESAVLKELYMRLVSSLSGLRVVLGVALVLILGISPSPFAQEPVDDPEVYDVEDELDNDEDPSIEYGVLDLLREYGSLDSIASYLELTGLDELLDSENAFTLFAPSDSVFEAIGGIGGGDASKPDVNAVRAMLEGCIVIGRSTILEHAVGDTLVTLSGDSVAVSIVDDKIRVGSAIVTDEGLWCENGVVHVINSVLVSSKGHR